MSLAYEMSDLALDRSVMNDDAAAETLRKGSRDLLAALWREHPSRMRSLFMVRKAEAPPSPPPPPANDDKPAPVLAGPRLAPGIARQVIASVATAFNVKPEAITGRSRVQRLIFARAVCVAVLRDRGWSYPRIGQALGGRDHTTILNLKNKLDAYAKLFPTLPGVLARQVALFGAVRPAPELQESNHERTDED